MIVISDEGYIIVGADILPQTSSLKRAYYAVSIYDAGKEKELSSYERVTFYELLRIVRDTKAKYLASDNIYELVPNPAGIPPLCSKLLPSKLVQVTGSPIHGFISLHKLMKIHGIATKGKETPLESAQASAILAHKKVGYIIEPFEEETKIIVSRSRSKGPGGWSQARYGRLYDTTIKQEAKNIEDVLIENKMDFDKREAKSKFGAKKVSFNVYGKIEEVNHLIKKQRGEICQVNIFPVHKESVEFIPLTRTVSQKTKLRNLIVGIDPGLTIGLAILNLNGKVLKVDSFREATRGDIIRAISRYGRVSLLCTDKFPYPLYAEKLAATLNAKLYSPRSVMTISEKNEVSRKIAMEQNCQINNAHERDSLSAAYKGYTKYRVEFEHIDKKYSDEYDQTLRDYIKDAIVKGKSISEALAELDSLIHSESEERDIVQEDIEVPTPKPKSVEDLEQQLSIMQDKLEWERKKNLELYSENKDLERKISFLDSKLDNEKAKYLKDIQREKVVRAKNSLISAQKERINQLYDELSRLGQRIDELKRVAWLRGKEGWVPLKVLKKFTAEDIDKAAKNYGLGPGDNVLILDITGGGGQTVDLLLSFKIKSILGNIDQLSYNAKRRLLERRIPLGDIANAEIIRIDEIAIINENNLNTILAESQKEIDELLIKEKESFISSILTDYRKEREKEIELYEQKMKKEKEKEKEKEKNYFYDESFEEQEE